MSFSTSMVKPCGFQAPQGCDLRCLPSKMEHQKAPGEGTPGNKNEYTRKKKKTKKKLPCTPGKKKDKNNQKEMLVAPADRAKYHV